MSGDYSRKTFKAKHNYSGVLMQQGRVQLDADWNEQQAINFRRQRAQTVDTMGRAVVPMETPDGFKIELDANGLHIHPGRLYVDGLLAENHGSVPEVFDSVLDELKGTAPVLYQDQPFFPNASELAPLPSSGTGIAYLDVWQREVSSVEQPGLIEPAVGVDTTTRWQTVWQVKVLAIDADAAEVLDCADPSEAWDQLTAASAGRLSTAVVAAQETEDVCLLPSAGGYRALENRLYRVEIHDAGGFDTATFKWSRHNASIVTTVRQINGTVLTVAQAQWDAVRRFNIGDWIEITDDVRELSGQAGVMRQVTDADYTLKTITLDAGLAAGDFPTDANQQTQPERHTRVRRWDQKQGADLNTGVSLVTNQDTYLEDGIQLRFSLDAATQLSGQFEVGDYWLFYARSATASIDMLDQAPPRGIHHHYARLAVLNFPDQQQDCRSHWPPEFNDACCCTITVGDGQHSHGQFNSIQAAIDHMPAAGGNICVLAGRYSEHVQVINKQNIRIVGCGSHTIITSRESSKWLNIPLIYIENSQHIEVENLSILSKQQGAGILIRQKNQANLDQEFSSVKPGKAAAVRHIRLVQLNIRSGTGSAIRCEQGEHLVIQDNVVRMRNESSPWPGIYLQASNARLIGNQVTVDVEPTEAANNNRATRVVGRGGIQLGGMSERVQVRDNVIQAGAGDGITLGSLSLVGRNEELLIEHIALIMVPEGACDVCQPPPIRIPIASQHTLDFASSDTTAIKPGLVLDDLFLTDAAGAVIDPPELISAGDLYDIEIHNNQIENMGRSGIGVVGFFDLEGSDEFISIENLSINHNRIDGCLNSVLPAIDTELEDDMGYGGITLADVMSLQIHDNEVINNGANPADPVCGVYVLHGEGLEICDNRICNNGVKAVDDIRYKSGARSGIHLVYATAPTTPVSLGKRLGDVPRQNGVPAAKIHNNIVVQPAGRALTINALGPVTVTDNQLTSRGVIKNADAAGVSTVSILNLGLSNELYLQLLSFSHIAKQRGHLGSLQPNLKSHSSKAVTFMRTDLDDFKLGRYLANGNVMFADNQVVLDEIDVFSQAIISATRILSLDDISFTNNQCDCSLLSDRIVFPNMLLAPSLRITDNRFKESLASALLSVLAIGWLNTTTNNQATHCILSRGLQANTEVIKDNIILLNALSGNDNPICERLFATIKG